MNCFIYQADIYCEDCGKALRHSLAFQPPEPADEYSYDSDQYPQHCASGEDCLEPLEIAGDRYGRFLENELTDYGREYTKETHADRGSALTTFWMEHYGLEDDSEPVPFGWSSVDLPE